jgi:hypothetical protein
MASSSSTPDFSRKSCGSSFEEKSNGVTDLSALAENSLLAGSSQSGGNTLSAKATSLQLATPGTPSEQTGVNVVGDALDDVSHVTDPASAPVSDVETHGDGEVFGL